jgi:hypothetical protein
MDEFTTYTTSSDSSYDTYTFKMPPTANVKLSLGDATNTYCQFYVENPPNAFHRWMTRKLLGIKIEII